MGHRSVQGHELRRILGRGLLAVFGVAEVAVGIWAAAFPRSFYDRFPGWGWHWVRASGPYSEHLVRDFGGALMGLAVVALLCAAQPGRVVVLAMVGGWEVEAVPHFVYHLMHQDVLPTTQDVANLIVLALAIVVPLLAAGLLWPGPDRSPADEAASTRQIV